jgi:hypothetical protein
MIEVHMADPLVSGPSRLEVEIAIAKLKNYKSPGSDPIPAELIQAGGKILLSVWNKEELPDQWNESIIVPVHKMGDKTDCNNYRGRPRRRWEHNIRMDLREVGWGDVDWIGLARNRNRRRALVNSVLNLRVP